MSHTDKILVVEDDDTLRLLTTKQLTRLGFASDAVEDGSHALRKTAENSYRLILMDVQMPQMDGIEATLAIREAEKAAGRARVPIIAVTANPDKSLCLNADMDDFLFKPVMLPELEQIMKKWAGAAKADSPPESQTLVSGKSAKDSASTSESTSESPQFGFAASSTSAAGSERDMSAAATAESSVETGINEAPDAIDASGSGTIID